MAKKLTVEQRVAALEDKVNQLEADNQSTQSTQNEIKEQLKIHSRSIMALNNTLHLLDATVAGIAYSTKKKLSVPAWKTPQDIADSGVSDYMMGMANVMNEVFKNEESKDKAGRESSEKAAK